MGQIAHQPEQHAFHGHRRRQHQHEADQRIEPRSHHYAGQQQPVGIPVRNPVRQQRNEDDNRASTDKTEQIPGIGAQAEQHGSENTRRGAAGDAKNVRIRQRVSQQGLQKAPCHRKQRTGHKCGKYARCAQLPDDIRGQSILKAQCSQYSVGAERDATGRQTREYRKHRKEKKDEEFAGQVQTLSTAGRQRWSAQTDDLPALFERVFLERFIRIDRHRVTDKAQ